jgi:D-glycero-beta-D-manno-heptose-7-phosphate kinase
MTLDLTQAKAVIDKFPGRRILVVGDLMLDRYIHGSVTRISPEAPVPVVHVTRETSVPGGASNVASNIRSLGGSAAVAGLIGEDAAGDELARMLGGAGVETQGVVRVPGMRTTLKTRVIAERQQCVRIDWEDEIPFTESLETAFCAGIRREIARASAVIVEDYDKGVVRQSVVDAVLQEARRLKLPVSLDPKVNEELNVEGITFATPNRKEAFIAARMEDSKPHDNPLEDARLLKVGDILLGKWKPAFLLITLGAHGMLLLTPDAAPRHVPTRAREVFDVSGAGDTVIAACTLAVAAGAGSHEAAEIANFAAGVVVGKLGTATCSPGELMAAMANH